VSSGGASSTSFLHLFFQHLTVQCLCSDDSHIILDPLMVLVTFLLAYFHLMQHLMRCVAVCNYGRPPASWPTAIIFYCWCFYHTFFRRLISEVSGPIVTKLCHMFGGDCNFLMWVKNLGGPSPKKFGGPKTSKFRISHFDREYLRTGTRYCRSENGVANCNHSPTSLPNLVNFGPQTAKNRTIISTHSIDFFGSSYLSSYLRAKGRCPLKIFSW